MYKEVDGIACVLYMKVGQQDGRISSMKIHKASLADWGMDEDEAYENALANTYFLTPPRIYKWECLLFNPDYEGDDFMDMNYEKNIVERNAGSYQYGSEKFYKMEIVVKRLRENVDWIPVVVSDWLVDITQDYTEQFVEIHGEFRSHNCHEEMRNRLELFVFAREVNFIKESSVFL